MNLEVFFFWDDDTDTYTGQLTPTLTLQVEPMRGRIGRKTPPKFTTPSDASNQRVYQ
jgi:hypothetical protein